MKIALSIDFDFFARENPMLDFSHTESMKLDSIWPLRYIHNDLVKEYDPKIWADFDPLKMKQILKKNDFHFSDKTEYGVADSHKFAYDFFKGCKVQSIINFDAHHDCWPIKNNVIDCSNWLTALPIPAIVIYPKWKDPDLDGEAGRKFELSNTKKLFKQKIKYEVSKVFICRSSAWVPPHLDPLFTKFLLSFLDGVEILTHIENTETRYLPPLSDLAKFRKAMHGHEKQTKPSFDSTNRRNKNA